MRSGGGHSFWRSNALALLASNIGEQCKGIASLITVGGFL